MMARCRAARAPVNDPGQVNGSDFLRRFTELPCHPQLPSKNDRGMWLKCGAAGIGWHGSDPVKNGLSPAFAGDARAAKLDGFMVDNRGEWPI
jgi:hypothetical protein